MAELTEIPVYATRLSNEQRWKAAMTVQHHAGEDPAWVGYYLELLGLAELDATGNYRAAGATDGVLWWDTPRPR